MVYMKGPLNYMLHLIWNQCCIRVYVVCLDGDEEVQAAERVQKNLEDRFQVCIKLKLMHFRIRKLQ